MARREARQHEAERRLRAMLHRDPRNDWARVVLASIRADQDGADAAELYQAAAEGFAARSDPGGEVLARVFLATYHQIGGRSAQAEAPLARARVVADATRDPLLVARVRVAEAWQSYRKGDHGRALRALDEVQEVVQGRGTPQLRSTWLSAKAIVCWALGRHAEAMELYQRQAEALREAGDRYEEAVARGNIVFMAPILGIDRAAIRPLAEELLATAIASGNRAMEARAHDYLSGLASGPEAIEHARQSLAMCRETKRTPFITTALRRLAGLLMAEDPEEARRLIEEAAGLAKSSGDLDEVARVAVARSSVSWKAGPRETAIADSLAALDAIEATRARQPEPLVRARRFSQWRQVYAQFAIHLLSSRLLAEGGVPAAADLELAFRVTEMRLARMLLDQMEAARVEVEAPKGPLAARHASALEGIVSAQRRLMDASLDPGGRVRTTAELARLEREDEALRAELARSHPGFVELRQPRLATLAELRAALADDEAFLSFLVVARDPDPATGRTEGCWLTVHTRHGTRLYRGSARALDAVPLFVGLFERRDGSEAVPAARLGAELLERALRDHPGVRRLVIVPDGLLHMVPFDALRVGEATPLGARYDVSVAPSATLWLRLRHSGTAASAAPALALSDPDLAGGAAGATERRWALDLDARLGRLPRARQEGSMIVRRLGGESRELSGPLASERFLKQADLARFALIHFAAHAVVDESRPERSAILLAPGAATEDGLLQLRELAALDLRRRVVVLSTCRSASGMLIGGEGLVSLAHGFFQAGAKTVVGALWPLRDDEAERLFDGFYRRLAGGLSVGEALAGARRERIEAGAPAAAWAGLVVLGDGAAVPLPGGRPSGGSRETAAGTIALLVGVAALLVRSRSRR